MEVEKLKKKILDLAIQGKLVPQDPNDEPASVLVEKIREEKQRLIREGKIKAPKEESYIYRGSDNCYYEKIGNNVNCINDYIPFEIPSMWSFVRMETVMDVRDGTHDTPEYCENGIPFVTTKCLIDGNIDFSSCKYISQKDADEYNKRSYVDNKDILLAMIGTIGKPIVVNKDREFVIKNVALLKNIDIDLLDVNWIKIVLEAYTEKMKYEAAGGLQPFVSLSFLRKMIIPIPPQYQIQRIVNFLDSFDKLSSIISSNKDELNTLIAKTKQRILEQIFDENSSYKSYYLKNRTTLLELIPKEKIGDGDWVLSSDMDENGDYSLVQLKHIGNGMYLDKDYCRVNNAFFSNHNCSEIKENYILINRIVSETMNVCLLPVLAFKTITSVDVCWIAPDENLYNQKYLMYLLMSPQFQQRVMLLCSGSTRQRISKKKLTNIAFKIHKREIQDRIVCDIEDKLSLLNLLSA